MFLKDGWYYLLIAEGGTDDLHRSTIARSKSPEGPWDPDPQNPILFNGQYGFDNLTVQSTGHATFVETESGEVCEQVFSPPQTTVAIQLHSVSSSVLRLLQLLP